MVKIEQECVTWDAKTASKYLGISYWLLLNMVKKHQVPFIKAGDRFLFRKETLDLWMKNQEIQSVQAEQPNNFGKLRKIQE